MQAPRNPVRFELVSTQSSDNFFANIDSAQTPSTIGVAVVHHAPCEFANGIMTDLLFKLTVNQFCSVIRQHAIDTESEMLLGMLESLVIAGEIPLHDFIERIQNLLPHIFARIDRSLLKKLMEIAAD